MYPIIVVAAGASELTEALGTKPKFWYTYNGAPALYKEGRPGSGEHWAEKVCCEICRLLAIPHAEYELAHWKGRQGVISPSFVPENGRLVLGNELIARFVRAYLLGPMRYKAKQHSVRRAMAVLALPRILPPIGYTMPSGLERARDLFVGYLMLDALVGNQDRHHENWGVVFTAGERVSLAPTFDHASSLGRNERDEERLRRLATKDRGSSVQHYAARAASAFYANPASDRPLSTLAAFEEAGRIAPNAAAFWLATLSRVSRVDFEAILSLVPPSEMSDPAKAFAMEMLVVNRGRLLGSVSGETG
jgi:hypothetical protein